MTIDFHTHTFPGKIAARTIGILSGKSHSRAFTDATNPGLLASMQEAGIDLSVVLPVATAPRQVEHINDSALAVNRSYFEGAEAESRGMLLSLGCMHPDYENWEAELERIAREGLKGIKIHPVYQGVDIDDPRYVRILKKCSELGLLVVMHAGDDIGFPGVVHCSPAMTRRAYEKAPGLDMVLAHMGGWHNWDEVPGYLSDLPVWLDTAFSTGEIPVLDDHYYKPEDLPMLNEEAFLKIVDAFGTERILFATDSPWADQRATLEWIRRLPLSPDDREAILGGNALRLLKKAGVVPALKQ